MQMKYLRAEKRKRRAERKLRRADKKGSLWAKKKKKLFDKQKGICALCGENMDYSDCNLDHKVPKSKGGHNGIKNLQATHRRCNSIKSNSCAHTLSRKVYEKIMEYRRFQR